MHSIKPEPTNKNISFVVGITAFTRTAIDNLLEKVCRLKGRYKTDEFSVIRLARDANKFFAKYNVHECKAEKLSEKITGDRIGKIGNPIVISGTVWDWWKVRKEWKDNWSKCDIMIIDEGSQVCFSSCYQVI